MNVLGVDLTSNKAILLTICHNNGVDSIIETSIKKITLVNDGDQNNIADFINLMKSYILDNKIECVFIKERPISKAFAGGPITYKIEGLIQSISEIKVVLIHPLTINAYKRKNKIELSTKYAYQREALEVAIVGATRNA